jgi:hypothetical protein
MYLRAFLLLAGTAGLAGAQQAINLDVGTNTTFPTPAGTYGAASGQTGTWNGAAGTAIIAGPIALLDTSGSPSGVTISGTGGFGDFEFNNVNTTGDDQRLLDDLFDAGTSQYTISGLADGLYNVYVYAWAPDARLTFFSDVTVQGGSKGTVKVGGADWSGTFVHGIHYMSDTVSVLGGAPIVIDIVNPVPVTPTSLNGIQIEPAGCNGAPTKFCTSKAGLVCGAPTISSSGTPSAMATSGFTISAAPARSNRSGILLYNTVSGPALPFQGGTLCIDPMGLRRAGSTNSMGTCPPAPTGCDGVFSIDMNAFAKGLWVVPDCTGAPSGTPPNNPAGFLTVAGTKVFTQWWGRDSVPTGSFVSEGLCYDVCP